MTPATKQQKSTAGTTTGSFINYMMGNNATVPEVGKGATILSWTDRHAYEVLEVSKDGLKCTLQQYNAKRLDSEGMSECQKYEYKELSGYNVYVTWRNGAWRIESACIEFVDSFYKSFEVAENTIGHNAAHTEMIKPLFDSKNKLMLIEGKTKVKKSYNKVNIIFGLKQSYHDFSF